MHNVTVTLTEIVIMLILKQNDINIDWSSNYNNTRINDSTIDWSSIYTDCNNQKCSLNCCKITYLLTSWPTMFKNH